MELKTNVDLFKHLAGVDMDISDAKFARLDTRWCADGICSPFTRIYMMLGGEAYISDKNEEIKMHGGSIYIVPAYHEFSYRCDASAEKIYFHISLLMTGNFDALAAVDRFVVIEGCGELIEEMKKMLEDTRISTALWIKSELYAIAVKCLKKAGVTERAPVYSALVKSAFEYVEKNLSASLSVTRLADALFVSQSKLQKAFKRETGISVGRYIDNCLMLCAERELRGGGKSISEISEQLGFCDRFYFSRLFAARYGYAPSRYRKMVCLSDD